jgi:Domain of unknown function (DUF4491)
MNYSGLIIGAVAFLLIGVFHPLVIKTEYYFGKRIWPIYLIVGLGTVGLSLGVSNLYISAFLGVFGFSSLWSIMEMFEQEARVADGRFPCHPTASHHAHIREQAMQVEDK